MKTNIKNDIAKNGTTKNNTKKKGTGKWVKIIQSKVNIQLKFKLESDLN
jgi:hypothetical protein